MAHRRRSLPPVTCAKQSKVTPLFPRMMLDEARTRCLVSKGIVYLFCARERHDGNNAAALMHLTWETDLIDLMSLHEDCHSYADEWADPVVPACCTAAVANRGGLPKM